MKHLISILILLFISSLAHSQKKTFSGYVFDKKTGEVLIGANIFIPQNACGTSTNNFGFFSLNIPVATDSVTANISYIGYSSCEILIYANQKNSNQVYLFPVNQKLEELVVRSKRWDSSKEIGIINIPVKQLSRFPALGGETDVFKTIQLMPGIQSGKEGGSGLYVRGGSPDQNLMMIDDVPMYYVNHLGGFVSVFNNDILNQVKMYKGGFPARYGEDFRLWLISG